MRKLGALLLSLLLLFGLFGCSKPDSAGQDAAQTSTPPVSATASFEETAEERALLGTWVHPGGITVDFYQDDTGQFMFRIETEGYSLSPSTGSYEMKDGRLYLYGWFSENETEYSYDGNQLTMEINGCSFTLTKQVQKHEDK